LERERRRLAAILAADVASYSRLMSRDESRTLARLKEYRRERRERHAGSAESSVPRGGAAFPWFDHKYWMWS
jgi:class 3 adenylate cyclase